tara:strand:- start:390 stop:548 length:159 start_codon:yes stop_codon:yes gene_type:complete
VIAPKARTRLEVSSEIPYLDGCRADNKITFLKNVGTNPRVSKPILALPAIEE